MDIDRLSVVDDRVKTADRCFITTDLRDFDILFSDTKYPG